MWRLANFFFLDKKTHFPIVFDQFIKYLVLWFYFILIYYFNFFSCLINIHSSQFIFIWIPLSFCKKKKKILLSEYYISDEIPCNIIIWWEKIIFNINLIFEKKFVNHNASCLYIYIINLQKKFSSRINIWKLASIAYLHKN